MTPTDIPDPAATRQRLAAMIRPVHLRLFPGETSNAASVAATRRLLDALTALGEKVSWQETLEPPAFAWSDDQNRRIGPVINLLREGRELGIGFAGSPTGYEFPALLDAILAASTDTIGLSTEIVDYLKNQNKNIDILVFVTHTCVYCPAVVRLANQMALANDLIRVTTVQATEFLDLSQRFQVSGVPMTVVNETRRIVGVLPEVEYVQAVLGLDRTLQEIPS